MQGISYIQYMHERALSFGKVADIYEASRPTYPDSAIDICLGPNTEHVLDLGAGTGKLTRSLLDRGLQVTAIEPDEQMRKLLPSAATIIAGSAEQIPLPDGSVDAVLIGQAFHWFDQELALAEIIRILTPEGRIGILWNLLDDQYDWVSKIHAIVQNEDVVSKMSFDPPYHDVAGLVNPQCLQVAHTQTCDLDGLLASMRSRSKVSMLPTIQQEQTLRQISAVAPAGTFELPYVCTAWHGRRS